MATFLQISIELERVAKPSLLAARFRWIETMVLFSPFVDQVYWIKYGTRVREWWHAVYNIAKSRAVRI